MQIPENVSSDEFARAVRDSVQRAVKKKRKSALLHRLNKEQWGTALTGTVYRRESETGGPVLVFVGALSREIYLYTNVSSLAEFLEWAEAEERRKGRRHRE